MSLLKGFPLKTIAGCKMVPFTLWLGQSVIELWQRCDQSAVVNCGCGQWLPGPPTGAIFSATPGCDRTSGTKSIWVWIVHDFWPVTDRLTWHCVCLDLRHHTWWLDYHDLTAFSIRSSSMYLVTRYEFTYNQLPKEPKQKSFGCSSRFVIY